MRKGIRLAPLRLFMPQTPEGSRKRVRYWIKLTGIVVLLTWPWVLFGDYRWDYGPFHPVNLLEWVSFWIGSGFLAYICIQIGIAAAHGWPELVSDRMNLSPKLQYEEE